MKIVHVGFLLVMGLLKKSKELLYKDQWLLELSLSQTGVKTHT